MLSSFEKKITFLNLLWRFDQFSMGAFLDYFIGFWSNFNDGLLRELFFRFLLLFDKFLLSLILSLSFNIVIGT